MAEEIDGVRVRRFPYFYPYIGLSREARHLLDRKGGSPFSFSLMRALNSVPDLDLIHLHAGNRIGGIGRYIAQRRRIPYVVSLHGGVFDVPVEEAATWSAPSRGSFEWGKIFGWWVGSRRVLDDAAAILCVGYNEKTLTQERYPNKRVIHLPNGVDPVRFARGDGLQFRAQHGIPPDAYVILTVGRIDRQKNQLLPARLLPKLHNIHPKTHLLFVGNVTSPAYYDELTAVIRNVGIERHVTIVPGLPASAPDLVDAYHASDVFLLPSIHEPFGIVILEAWAAGKPVLASNVGGIRHLVEHSHDALSFDPGDEQTFLEVFEELARNPETAKRVAEAGMKKAHERFDWDVITRSLIEIYEDAVDAGAPEK